MNQPQQQQAPKRTAVQRLDDLERALMGMFQAGDVTNRDVQTLKEAIKLLGNKVDAIVKATQQGEDLNDEILSRIMVENNVAELKGRVDQLVANGALLPTTEAVDEKSFVVGREIDADGKVLNPRLQFVLQSLQEPLRLLIMGKKVGDTVEFQEGKLKFELQEAYTIAPPKPPEAPVVVSTEQAAEAAAAEQSSTDASNDSAPQSSPASES